MFELSEEKQRVINTAGHILVMGGPGSGKTTIALLKALHIINSGFLNNEQKILFLSFARATISRVEQHARNVLGKLNMSKIEIATYHSFVWSVLKSHGYLLVGKRVRLLPPHEATVKLSGIKNEEKVVEKERLFTEEGLLHFDLFASKCAELFKKSQKLLKIISSAYPFIILDEFQDTNAAEWDFISLLGKNSIIIALADPEQRIYDFKGADPKRISQFINTFNPVTFDFGTENNRSKGTDILEYGNDLLTGKNKGKKYRNVKVYMYQPFEKNNHLINLKTHILKRIKANKDNPEWSLAVLTPSNSLMIAVSDFFSRQQEVKKGNIIPAIHHEVTVDTNGPIIAAIMIARILEEGSQKKCSQSNIVTCLCDHILGWRGDNTSVPRSDQSLVRKLIGFVNTESTQNIRSEKVKKIVDECREISDASNQVVFTGDVATDWINVRELFASKESECFRKVYKDSLLIKLLRKGSLLNSTLGRLWRENGSYKGATEAVKNAIVQEHFATSIKTWRGINVMTIHKSKGKEFDEVIIIDGAFPGQRIVYKEDVDRARLNLRVAVTRARSDVIILTPKKEPCCLL